MNQKICCFLLVSSLLFTGSLHAQKLKWGPEAGGNMFRTNYQLVQAQGGTARERVNSRLSGKVGLIIDKNINRFFSFQPGLFFNSKSFVYGIDWWYRVNYLELPVNAVFRVDIDSGTAFYAAIGPYGAVGLNGTENYPYVRYGGIKFGSEKGNHFKRFNAGLNISSGLEFKSGLYFRLLYSIGVTDISPDEAVRERLRGFGFSLGYFF